MLHTRYYSYLVCDRYDLNKVFMTPKRIGTHPKEIYEYYFDVVSPSAKYVSHGSISVYVNIDLWYSLVLPASETISVVMEVVTELSLIQVLKYIFFVCLE